VTISSDTIFIGYPGYVHVNATDDIDLEQELKIHRIEWRENSSSNNDPPNDPWHTDSTKLNINLDEGYSPGGYLRASISPSDTAWKGRYDIRVRINDTDGNNSYWYYVHNAFTTIPPPLIFVDITLQYAEVFRGGTIYITLNATNLINCNESELTVEILYRKFGSMSKYLSVTPDMYNTTDGGYWKVPFSPGLDWDDDKLGTYEFLARFMNKDGAYPDGGQWNSATGNVEVKNNAPIAISLSSMESTVERGSSVLLFAEGNDLETMQRNLNIDLEFRKNGGTSWKKPYIDRSYYNNGDSQWEFTFIPESDATLGSYDFRIRFEDGEDYGDWLVEENLVTLTNAVPEVTSLFISNNIMSRMYSVTFDAIVSDADQNFKTLLPNFQYKGPNDEDWVGLNESDYFGEPRVFYSRWSISFSPPFDADLGTYSFRLEVTDENGNTSEPYDLIDVLIVENSAPWVHIESPRRGSQDFPIITFEADSFDEEDTELSWLWNFGDGETSTEESPVHAYTERGDYTVTVTVTDADGDTGNDVIALRIRDGFNRDSDDDGLTDLKEFELGTDPEDSDTDSDGVPDGQDYYPLDSSQWLSPLQTLFQGVLLVVVILTLILSYFAYRRLKKKGKKDADS
jgi:hypothetical protein